MEIRILSPTAILGYGFPVQSLEYGVSLEPDVIAVDGGSTDPGPYYLGEGVPFVSAKAVERDLFYLVKASTEREIPLLIGSAGGAGAEPHVNWTLERLRRITQKLGTRLKAGVIYTDVDKGELIRKIESGTYNKPIPHSRLSPLKTETISNTKRIVAQVGVEPFTQLLKEDVDVIVAGRSVDIAPFAALPWLKGMDKGLAVHLGKILECGAIAAEPGSGSDGMMGILRDNEFEVFPLNPSRRATMTSIAEHAMYERTDPFREHIPGGYSDMSSVLYEETGDGRVVVKGSRWIPVQRRLVKLEGASFAGYRFIVIAGARDPDFLSRIDGLVSKTLESIRELVGDEGYSVHLRVYGRDGVMGDREPEPRITHEAGLVFEVLADEKDKAKTVAGLVRSTLLHIGWEGRKTTAGNLAFPFSPSDIDAGRAYTWSVWHLIEEENFLEYSRMMLKEV
ncbi:MAG: DUF1446 domain-containing protein [Desulfurococcales archaeon]|nr:DUF1446 domain-containing protein [Desulfurococcales archaeon]